MKTIKCNLTRDGSLTDTIQKIEKYEREFLPKVRRFVQKLGLLGISVVESNLDMDDPHKTYFVIDDIGLDGIKGTLTVEGEGLYFYEFGTGIHFNVKPSPHPYGAKLGMTIGGYGKGLGNYPSWSYKDDSGARVTTEGIKAQLPVYRASLRIITDFERVAKEVFKYD